MSKYYSSPVSSPSFVPYQKRIPSPEEILEDVASERTRSSPLQRESRYVRAHPADEVSVRSPRIQQESRYVRSPRVQQESRYVRARPADEEGNLRINYETGEIYYSPKKERRYQQLSPSRRYQQLSPSRRYQQLSPRRLNF